MLTIWWLLFSRAVADAPHGLRPCARTGRRDERGLRVARVTGDFVPIFEPRWRRKRADTASRGTSNDSR